MAISIKRAPNLPSLPVTGHEHIAPGRKTDPGPYFDWEKLFQSIGKAHDGRYNLLEHNPPDKAAACMICYTA